MKSLISAFWVLGLVGASAAADLKTINIRYYDAKTQKEELLKDYTIQEESPAGIKIKPRTGPVRTLSALDVREIDYVTEKVGYTDWRKPFGLEARALLKDTKDAERLTLFKQAIDEYESLRPKLADEKELARYLQYRQAAARANWARYEPAQTDAAIEALTRYRTDHSDGWEIGPALKTLAELQRDKGDFKAAEKAYADLAAIPGIPAELRWECDMRVADVMLETDRAKEAQARLDGLAKSLPQNHPYRARVQVGLIRCQIAAGNTAQAEKQLRDTLQRTQDPTLKALVHNTLGDYYQTANRAEDAFWEYLKVDVQYTEDKTEHARALYHLSKLFRTVKKNAERADACKNALLTDSRFDGLEYQKRAKQEK